MLALTVNREKYPIVAAVSLAALMLPLSFSGGAVATPAIGRALGGEPVQLNWITNAFMLSFGSSLMAAGSLADRFGRKRLFTAGVAVFASVSVVLGFVSSVLVLDLLRGAQGFAAACALAGGTAALAQEFEGHVRTRVFSLIGTTFGVGLAFGPILAGYLIRAIGWRAVFATTAVMGAVAFFVGHSSMHESRGGAGGVGAVERFDWAGMAAFTAMLSLFTFGVIQAPISGWSSPLIILLLGGALISLVAFLWIELRSSSPMLELSLLRYPRFLGVQLLPIATCYSYVVLLVLLPLRLIGVEGLAEAETGLLMIALSAPLLVVPMIAASVARWVAPGILAGVGLLTAAVGLFFLSRVAPGAPRAEFIFPMLAIGIGTGLPWGLMDGLSVSVVPRERAGMATGIFSTVRVAGEGIALAIVTALLSQSLQARLVGAGGEGAPISAEVAARTASEVVAGGSLRAAHVSELGLHMNVVMSCYEGAFRSVSYVLVAITVVSAIAAFVFLGRVTVEVES